MTKNLLLSIVASLLCIGVFLLGFGLGQSTNATNDSLVNVVVADRYIDLSMAAELLKQLDQGNVDMVRSAFCTRIAFQVISLNNLLPSCDSRTADSIRRLFARVARHIEEHPFPDLKFEEEFTQALNAALSKAEPNE